ncbi:MAG: hypothetical protein J2P26_03490, partial [Nocardiopsaceae bacterium]|nr:hypothetical protein [Nocardiopsaceae bacterium]
DGCAGLTETLLLGTEGVTVLATSRQPLDVSGENACPVAPLPVPADGERPSPGDATDLFTRLAAAGGVAIADASQPDVIRLCRRLDGIPLAIELAAARLRTMPLAELADAPLDAIPGKDDPGKTDQTPKNHSTEHSGPDSAEPRHETLDRAIAWSYDLCGRAEQALWQRFSVFADAVGLDAAEEVCAGPDLPPDALVETLIGLVEKSVLRREPAEEPARFRMLDTIREFGARELAASGAEAAVKGRLARRYLNLARRLDEDLLGDEQFSLYERVRREHASLNVALNYCFDSREGPFGNTDLDFDLDRAAVGVELVTTGFWYWVVAGLPREGIRWVDRVLGDPAVTGAERARALAARCLLDSTAGQGPQSAADGRECVTAADESGDRGTGARGYLFLAIALAMTQDFRGALEASAEAERRLTALDDRAGLGILALTMTVLHLLAEEFPEGRAWYERGVRLIGQSRERALSGWLHLTGGYILLRLGHLDESAAAWRLALRAKHDHGDIVGTAVVLEGFALMAVLAGRNTRAAWLLGAAQPLWDRVGAVLFNVRPLVSLHEQFLGQVRNALGTRRFDTLVRRGERSPLPVIVELAIADADELPAAQARNPSGARVLTSREKEVAELASLGLSHREIAGRMSVSKRTVDAHLEHIYGKLGLSSWQELAVWLAERGLP